VRKNIELSIHETLIYVTWVVYLIRPVCNNRKPLLGGFASSGEKIGAGYVEFYILINGFY